MNNYRTNTNNTTKNNNSKEGRNMKNMTIKERREEELKLKEARRIAEETIREEKRVAEEKARLAAERKAYLDSIEQKDIVATMEDTATNRVRSQRTEDNYLVGINGGKYYQEFYKGQVITGKSPEELEILKSQIDQGIQGDGKFHKTVWIDGKKCDCTGATIEELEADIKAAEEFAAAHRNYSMYKAVPTAEDLDEAGYRQEDLEQVRDSEGNLKDDLICYDGNYIMGINGETKVDLSDLTSKLNRQDVKTLLVERLEVKEAEETTDLEEDEYYEDNEYYDEENEEYEEY